MLTRDKIHVLWSGARSQCLQCGPDGVWNVMLCSGAWARGFIVRYTDGVRVGTLH